MIYKTIGVDGDYASLHDAMDSQFFGSDPGDDYTYDLISSVTEPAGAGGPHFFKNWRHSTTVKCSYNEAHKTAPSQWYTITQGYLGVNGYVEYWANTYGFSLEFKFLKILFTGGGQVQPYIAGLLQPGTSNSEEVLIDVHDCIFKGINLTNYFHTPIATGGKKVKTRVTNCRFFNLNYAVALVGNSAVGGQSSIVENNVAYSCKTALYRWALWVRETVDANNFTTVSIKNFAIAAGITLDCSTGLTNADIINCADSDNSIASSGADLTDNITGIMDGDFLSVDPDSDSSFKINASSKLYNAGSTDISAWNTADAFGLPRPNYRISVSIGIHEPISADVVLRVRIAGEYYTKTKRIDL